MQGKIIKGIAGFYYVHVPEASGIYECKARGIFRKENTKPLVGDDVELEVLDWAEKKGNIVRLLPRKNTLLRPAVANVDQALVIFAISRPDPNFNLLDRFLITMERQHLPCIVCFNKQDIASEEEKQMLTAAYEGCGYPVLFASFRENEGIEAIKELLQGKTTTVAGPSGVGKSSLINELAPAAAMETGEVSRKIGRGRNTTRHTELFAVEKDTYILDTPGFSSLHVTDLEPEELRDCYPEFSGYEEGCRFAGCAHIHEPDCAVKQALEEGKISRIRYENYCVLHRELQERKRY